MKKPACLGVIAIITYTIACSCATQPRAPARVSGEFCGDLQDVLVKNSEVVTEGTLLRSFVEARYRYKVSYADLSDEVRRTGLLSHHACVAFWENRIGPEQYTRLLLAASTPLMWLETEFPDIMKQYEAKGYTNSSAYLRAQRVPDEIIEEKTEQIRTAPPLFLMNQIIEISQTPVLSDPPPASMKEFEESVARVTGALLEPIAKSISEIQPGVDIDSRTKFDALSNRLDAIENRLFKPYKTAAHIAFRKGRADLTKEEESKLRFALSDYRGGVLRVRVVGYADRKGNPQTNERLSLSRANCVARWITKELGVPLSAITVMAGGPTAAFSQSGGLSANRRAVVYVSASPEQSR